MENEQQVEPPGDLEGAAANVCDRRLGPFGMQWLELLSEIAPGPRRAAIMFNPDAAPVRFAVIQDGDPVAQGRAHHCAPSWRQFQMVVNLKTAKTLSLTMPPTLVAVADEVIE